MLTKTLSLAAAKTLYKRRQFPKPATPPKTLTFNPVADALWQQMHLSILKFMKKLQK